MKVTYTGPGPNRTGYQSKTWELGQPIPNVFPYDVISVRLDGEEMLQVRERSVIELPGFENYDGDLEEVTLYGDHAKLVFGNMSVWSADEDDEIDEDEDD